MSAYLILLTCVVGLVAGFVFRRRLARPVRHDWRAPPNPAWDASECRRCGKIASAAELSSTLYGGAQDCCPSTAGIVPPDA